jgi:hypothetical protein
LPIRQAAVEFKERLGPPAGAAVYRPSIRRCSSTPVSRAIREGREPNASLAQCLPAIQTLGKLEQQLET